MLFKSLNNSIQSLKASTTSVMLFIVLTIVVVHFVLPKLSFNTSASRTPSAPDTFDVVPSTAGTPTLAPVARGYHDFGAFGFKRDSSIEGFVPFNSAHPPNTQVSITKADQLALEGAFKTIVSQDINTLDTSTLSPSESCSMSMTTRLSLTSCTSSPTSSISAH